VGHYFIFGIWRNKVKIEEAAKILKVSPTTAFRKCVSGEYVATHKETKVGRHGFEWDVDDNFVVSLAATRLLPTQASINRPGEPVKLPENVSEKREIVVNSDKALSKKEAERIIKQEDAIRKQRDNLFIDEKIVFADKVKDALSVYFGSLLDELDGIVDQWAIRYNFIPQQARNMTVEMHGKVREAWNRVKEQIH
jgi:hypothetical protein